MAVSFDLPVEIEQQLRAKDPKLDDSAREAFLVSGYRAGRISTGDIACVLGFETRHEAEAWLAKRGVTRNYAMDDLKADWATVDRLFWI